MLERRSGSEGAKRDSEFRTQTQKKVDTFAEAAASPPRARGPRTGVWVLSEPARPLVCLGDPCFRALSGVLTTNTAYNGNYLGETRVRGITWRRRRRRRLPRASWRLAARVRFDTPRLGVIEAH